MATVTGTNLLDSVLAETGATMSDAAKLVTAARLQQMIDAGFDSGLEIALVLSAASSELRGLYPVLGDLATVVEGEITKIEESDDPIVADFNLTVDDDTFIGTDGDDVIVGETLTLNDGDLIIDQNSDDNDTLYVTYKAADITAGPTPTISGIENINVDLQVFTGGEFDATNVTGATITGSSAKLGFDGEFTATAAGDNNVAAGTNVTDLIVTGLEEGTVDAGSADTVDITVTADTTSEEINLTVNGDVDATVTYSATSAEELLNVTATAASVLTLNAASVVAPANLTVTGTGDLNIDADADDVTGSTITGVGILKITENGANALNAVNLTVDAIEYADNADLLTISNATGQTVSVTVEDATITVDGENAAGETATVNVSADQVAGTITLTDMDSFTVNLTSDVAEIATLAIEGETTVNVAGDVALTDVNKATATDELILTGAGNVEVTDVDDVASVNSSALDGNLDLTLSVDADVEIIAGAGDDDITIANTTTIAAIETGGGTNTIDATSITTGTLAVNGGAGVDTVKLHIAAGDAATIAMDGGAGEDVVNFADATDITDVATWAVVGFTTITVTDALAADVVAQTVDMLGSQLDGFTSLAITGPTTGTSDDTLELTVDADEATTDLSSLVVADTDAITLVVNGLTTADTIHGTNADDTIITNGGADAIDISQGGSDEITIAVGESASTAMVSIAGFSASDTLSAADTLTSNGGTILADTAVTGAVDVKDAITGGAGTEDVTVSIDANGIATLAGDDAGLIDTLAEWIAVMGTDGVVTQDEGVPAAEANYAAFEFDGNTYVVYQEDIADTWANSAPVLDIIELTGIEGVTALDATAGVNTVIIA